MPCVARSPRAQELFIYFPLSPSVSEQVRNFSHSTMFNSLTKIFTSGPSAGQLHSAAIDAQLAADSTNVRNTARILVLGPAGSGKSALLRLLGSGTVSAPSLYASAQQHPSRDVQDVVGNSVVGDGGGGDEDSYSTVSSVTLAASGDYEAGQQEAEESTKGDNGFSTRRAANPINEVMLPAYGGLYLHFAEAPGTLSRKVMHQFEFGTTNTIVYSIDLSSYADTTPDPRPASLPPPQLAPAPTSQLQASLDTLKGLLNSMLIYQTHPLVIVLFTNADRLATKLRATPFRYVFPAFEGEETVRGVAEYVLTLLKQLNVGDDAYKTRIRWVYPAVLNLAEEDKAKRATTRAGLVAFLTDVVLMANLRVVSCFCTSGSALQDFEDEKRVNKEVLEEVGRGAWDGTVLTGWELR